MFNDFKIKKEALPTNIPVFPLNGVVLLPGVELPLNIFEPRYINMVDDALAEKKLIGLAQPKQGIFSKIRKNKPLYQVGCAGKIKAYNETEDGRYLIVLSGVCRFELKEEISTMRGYRRFKVDFEDYYDDFEIENERKLFDLDIPRKEFFEIIDNYLAQYDNENRSITSFESFDKMNDAFIIDFITSYLPFEPQEKQLFIEAKTLQERAEILFKILGLAEAKNKYINNPTIH